MTSTTTPPPTRQVSSTLRPGTDTPRQPAHPTTNAVDLALLPARMFLAFGWLRAGVEKAIDPEWWSGDGLTEFVDDQRSSMLSFAEPLLDAVVLPLPALTAFVIMVSQFAIAAVLVTGRRLAPGLLVASALNVAFVVMGAVAPSAFYLVLQGTLLAWWATSTSWFSVQRRAVLGLLGAAATVTLAPFIRSLHPADVIHDPAVMLATLGFLVAGTQVLALAPHYRVAKR